MVEGSAVDVRVAGSAGGEVVGNSIRTAERLGRVVLPMPDDLAATSGCRRQPDPG